MTNTVVHIDGEWQDVPNDFEAVIEVADEVARMTGRRQEVRKDEEGYWHVDELGAPR